MRLRCPVLLTPLKYGNCTVHLFVSITAQPRLIHFSIIESGDIFS